MSITYVNDRPTPSHNPSNDVGDMKANCNAIPTWTAIDHIGFNSGGDTSGTHKQITFNNEYSQIAPTDPKSILYTAAGTASTKADLRYINQNGTFPISAIRACGSFLTAGGVLQNSFNVASVSAASPFVVTLTANSVHSANPIIIVTTNSVTSLTSLSYTFAFPALTLTITSSGGGSLISFVILEI